MTVKETIAVLEEMVPRTCKMVNGYLKGGFKDWNSAQGSAINMAIEALQKQVPKKPVIEEKEIRHEFYDEVTTEHYTSASCPECKKCFGNVHFGIPEYCPNCGQHIDLEGITDE